jgi:hypothetical protein
MLIQPKSNQRWPYIPAAFTYWVKQTPAIWWALNDNMVAAEYPHRDQIKDQSELAEDDLENLTEAQKILREASILESIAERLMSGEDIDWEAED